MRQGLKQTNIIIIFLLIPNFYCVDEDMCFQPDFHLSKVSLHSRDRSNELQHLFHGGNLLVSWAIIAAPKHPIMLRSIASIVEVLKYEYLVKSTMKKQFFDFNWKICMCATGPSLLTAAAAEVIIEKTPSSEYRIAGRDFADFKGRFKVSSDRQSDTHYMKLMKKGSSPSLLKSYAVPQDGSLIQCDGQKAIYMVAGAKKRAVPDFPTFISLNLTLSSVQNIAPDQFENITIGEPLPSSK